jgi:Zn-dependent oligopeptidase
VLTQEITKLENHIKHFILNNDNKMVSLSSGELVGLPDNYVNSLKKVPNVNKYSLMLNKYNYNICMQNISNAVVRKNLELIYSAKAYDIVTDVGKLIVLRDKYAKLLSYKSYADYKAELDGVAISNNIRDFLTNLIDKVDYRYCKEVSTLEKLNGNKKINSWDLAYYIGQWRKEYCVNDKYFREFFPLKHVIGAILAIYEEMFQLKFNEIHDQNGVWHPSVKTFSVSDTKTLKIIGYFYMDLYKRDGKYDQTSCFVIRQACMYPLMHDTNSSEYQTPIIALVASYNPIGKLYLLTHSEVTSLFQEFGYVIYNILGKTKYSLFSGTNVENDFVATPAQVLEYLCWDKNILKRLSSHFKTNKCLPDDVIDKMVKMRDIDIGVYYKKHCLIGIYDLLINSSDVFINLCSNAIKSNNSKGDLINIFTNIYKKLHQQLLRSSSSENTKCGVGYNEGMLFPGVWLNYLFCGLNSGNMYYSMLWSKMYAAEIYNSCKGDIKVLGQILKCKILCYGGSKSSSAIMTELLDRPPSMAGFIQLHSLEQNEDFSYFFSTDRFTQKVTPFINESSSDSDEATNECIEFDDSSVASCSNKFSEICVKSKDKSDQYNYLRERFSMADNQIEGRHNKNIFIRG